MSSIFHPNTILKVTHILNGETYTVSLPIFREFNMTLSEEELGCILYRANKHMKWFENNNILTEENKEELLKLCLSTPPPQLNLFNDSENLAIKGIQLDLEEIMYNVPQKFEIIESWGILFTLLDDYYDNTASREIFQQDKESFKTFGTNVVSFLKSILYGEYKTVDDLPEFINAQYPQLYLSLKGILLRVNQLKEIEPNYKETMKYALDTLLQGIQAVFLNLVEKERSNFPIGLFENWSEIMAGGSLTIEGGILAYEHYTKSRISARIRNHILFSRLKELAGIVWCKVNSIIGLGVDWDRNDKFQSPISFKFYEKSNKKTFKELLEDEVKEFEAVLYEIDVVSKLFIEKFPGNPQVQFITLGVKFSYGTALRLSYLSDRYDSRKNEDEESLTKLEFISDRVLQVKPNLLDFYVKEFCYKGGL